MKIDVCGFDAGKFGGAARIFPSPALFCLGDGSIPVSDTRKRGPLTSPGDLRGPGETQLFLDSGMKSSNRPAGSASDGC
jgi:hypothetical protein